MNAKAGASEGSSADAPQLDAEDSDDGDGW